MKQNVCYVTGSELCYLLGIRELMFIKLRSEGLPSHKVGLRRVYDLDEVYAWLRDRPKRLRGEKDCISCTMK